MNLSFSCFVVAVCYFAMSSKLSLLLEYLSSCRINNWKERDIKKIYITDYDVAKSIPLGVSKLLSFMGQ